MTWYYLNFYTFINEKLGKTKIAEPKIKELIKIYKLFLAIIRQIQVAVV